MNYVNSCPSDRFYTIANNSPACYSGWHNVLRDHTGNNGNMMIINADLNASIFYQKEVGNLCPNTTYRFSVWILNLIQKSFDGPGIKHPRISFSIEKTDGTVLQKSPLARRIEPHETPVWVEDFLEFTTTNEDRIILKMTNMEDGGVGNDLIIDDITFRPCGPLTTAKFSSTNQKVLQMCQGEAATHQMEAEVTDPAYQNYQWQAKTNNGSWQDISGGNNDNLTLNISNAVTGIYQYRVGVAKNGNLGNTNCRIYSTPLTINVNPLPVVNIDDDLPPFCEGQPLTVLATGGVRYEWTRPGMPPYEAASLIIPDAAPAHSGTYSVRAISAANCYSMAKSFTIKVNPKINAVIDPIEAICEGESVQLNASGGLTYKWTPSAGLNRDDIPNPIATPSETTIYKVSVSVDDCSNEVSIPVRVLVRPKANAPADKEIFEGESVLLDAAPVGDYISYSWWPSTGLDNPLLATPRASPTEDIIYVLTVQSATCGYATDSVFVRVYKKIVIPNTFTPNGDGINDTWQINALNTYPQSIVSIFNRSGQQLFYSIGYSRAWDGTYNGAPLPAGTYYYVIDLKNKTPKRSGFIMLLR